MKVAHISSLGFAILLTGCTGLTAVSQSVKTPSQPVNDSKIDVNKPDSKSLDKYVIDPHHANVRFAVNHMKTSTVTGGFYELTGELAYSSKLKQGSIDIEIPMDSIHSVSKLFVTKLKSKDWFDVTAYPTARFKSTKWHFANTGDQAVTSVDGMLTMHGETKPVTLTANSFNCYFSPIVKKTMCGGDFSTVIDRTQWGISKYVLMGVPKDVQIDIEIEAIKQ